MKARSETECTADKRRGGAILRVLVAAAALGALAAAGAALAAPDLVVTNADVDTSVRSPTQGNTVTLEATVRNTGDANASAFTLRFTLDGSTTLANVAVAGLASGASTNVTASWAVGATASGAHTLEATADVTSSVAENSEANNQGVHAFDVNVPPTAAASVNVTTHDTLVPFAFSSATSSDSDGVIVAYFWLFDDGTTSSDPVPTHEYADGGPGIGKLYTVTLVVTDDDGGTDTAQVTLRVTNRAPEAVAFDVTGNTVTTLAFNGGSSGDLDGRIVNATWTFSDGMTLYGLTVLRSFDDDGAYTCTLAVTDDDGASDSTGCSITIDNQGPTAVIQTSPTMPFQPNTPAFFEGRNSFDVDGGIANYTWVFPGGTTLFGWNATYMFALNGTYNVSLVLVDDDGEVGELTIAALVGNDTLGTRVPTPPIGRIDASALTVYTGEAVQFDGSGSTDDTGIISYLWDFGDGATAAGVVAAHAWTNDGNYVVTLNVTDTDGNASFALVVVRVLDRPPVPVILASPTTALTFTSVSFDGGSSTDPDGSILFYRWNFGDGTVLYGRSVQHSYGRAGAYMVTLTATDNDGADASTTAMVTIQNRAPKAVVPANFSVPTFVERLFDGSGSFDQDGLIQTYTWDFGDGQSATGRLAKHAFATIGPFTVTLTVRDDLGASGAATMLVTVTNNGPTVSVTGESSIYTADTAVFTATAQDRDGSLASWAWNFGDGGTATTPNGATHPYPTRGTYTVTVTVRDDQGAEGSATFLLTVLNRLPTARITAPATAHTAPSLTPVSFNAGGTGGSSDPETPAAQLDYFWIFGDGGVASGASVSHAFQQAGTFTVILTVSDPHGGAASATLPVVITNQAPVAVPTSDASLVQTLTPVQFSGLSSTDPDGTVQSYLWDFGDGSTSSAASPEHSYRAAPSGSASYTVRLTVFDNLGLSHSATMQVQVDNRPPVGVIQNGEPLYASLTTFFRATDSTDADGLVTAFDWDFGDGAMASGAETSHVYGSAGTFKVKLTVTDDRGGVSVTEKDVTVQAKPTFNQQGPGTTTPQPTPGFESAGALAAVALAGLAAAGLRRRRQA
jgi:PKD repeat protein